MFRCLVVFMLSSLGTGIANAEIDELVLLQHKLPASNTADTSELEKEKAEPVEDTPGWDNGDGYGCKTYADRWCQNGNFRPGKEWTGSPQEGQGSECQRHLTAEKTDCAMVYNYPALNCVACGKEPVKDTPGWDNGKGYGCKDYADRWCQSGDFRPGKEWTGSPHKGHGSECQRDLTAEKTNCAMVYKFPALNCVACGKKGTHHK